MSPNCDLKPLIKKVREIEDGLKHRFCTLPKGAYSSFPSPCKDRSTGVYYYACLDCGRQIYSISGTVMGTAVTSSCL